MIYNNFTNLNLVGGRQQSGPIPHFFWADNLSVQNGFYLAESAESYITKSSFPDVTEPPYSRYIARDGGSLGSTVDISGNSTLSGSMANGINLEASIDGLGELTGSLSLITSLVASISSASTVTAQLSGAVQLAAVITSDSIVSASLGLIANLNATITSTSTIVADLKGQLFMSAIIYVSEASATVNSIVSGVWGAVAADNNDTGTMGEALNDAGAAGNPWATSITGNTNPGTFGELVGKKLLTVAKFLGLK